MNEQVWFGVCRYSQAIEAVRVEKETERTISIVGKYGGSRAVRTDKVGYFKTWEEAHAALLMRCEQHVASARRALEVANSTLGNVKGMKKPEEVAAKETP